MGIINANGNYKSEIVINLYNGNLV